MFRKNPLTAGTEKPVRTSFRYLWLIPAAILILILLCAFHASSFRENIRFVHNTPKAFPTAWSYEDGEASVKLEELPAKVSLPRETFTIRNTLPVFSEGDQVLYLNNLYQGFLVTCSGNILYEYGMKTETAPFVSLQRADHLISIPVQYSGTSISITFMNHNHPDRCTIPEIQFGCRDTVLLQLLLQNIGFIVFLVLCLFAGLILLALFLTQHYQKLEYDYCIFLHLGCFILLAGLWLATDSTLLQFWSGNGLVITLTSFFSFMLMPLPFLSLVSSVCKTGVRSRLLLQCAVVLNFLVQTVLYAAGFLDFTQMLPATHILFAVLSFHILYVLFREIRQTNSYFAKGMLAAITIFIAFAIAMLMQFYLNQEFWVTLTFRYGLALFLLALILLAIRRMQFFLREQSRMEVYKSMAYMDSLTQVGSRFAYELRMKGLEQEAAAYSRITFILHDVNRLKTANDTLGHAAGDELIRAVADCIRSTCRQIGDCYRIGGDEFFTILPDRNITPAEYSERLKLSLDAYNQSHSLQISLSFGIASSELPLPEGVTFQDLFRQADAEMYKMKKSLKVYHIKK